MIFKTDFEAAASGDQEMAGNGEDSGSCWISEVAMPVGCSVSIIHHLVYITRLQTNTNYQVLLLRASSLALLTNSSLAHFKQAGKKNKSRYLPVSFYPALAYLYNAHV